MLLKNIMKFLLGFVFGISFITSPDLFKLYEERVMHEYQKIGCSDLKDAKQCEWGRNGWYDKFEKENPSIYKLGNIILLGEGPVYWILSKRCTNEVFYNVSATKDSGKITKREYFYDRCSDLNIKISDLLFGE